MKHHIFEFIILCFILFMAQACDKRYVRPQYPGNGNSGCNSYNNAGDDYNYYYDDYNDDGNNDTDDDDDDDDDDYDDDGCDDGSGAPHKISKHLVAKHLGDKEIKTPSPSPVVKHP